MNGSVLANERAVQITKFLDTLASYESDPTLNVLIIDKNLTEIRLVDRILMENYVGAYALKQADSLEKAKDIINARQIDVVLLDCDTIEGQSKKDMIPALRAVDKQVPTILISNNVDMDYLEVKILSDVHRIVDKFCLRNRIFNSLVKPRAPSLMQTA